MNNVEQVIQQVLDKVTSQTATVGAVSAGVATMVTQLPLIIQVLSVIVLSAQVVAWTYRFYKWHQKQ